jgi:hypothetical protein
MDLARINPDPLSEDDHTALDEQLGFMSTLDANNIRQAAIILSSIVENCTKIYVDRGRGLDLRLCDIQPCGSLLNNITKGDVWGELKEAHREKRYANIRRLGMQHLLSDDPNWLLSVVVLNAPRTPTNSMTNASPDVLRIQGTPRKSDKETRALVEDFLSDHDAKLEEYIAGPPWNDFWRAPPSADPETAHFINNLEIPQVSQSPTLLLHQLGNDIVDESLIDHLFNRKSR